jgi:cytochrome oxidase Cu insertion factor (SCO1/SenC/PrrC family)
MTDPTSPHQRRQRRILIGLALFFFAPLAVSFFLYYGSGGWHPVKQVNRGDLINPARPLPAVSLPVGHDASLPGGSDERTKPDFLTGKWTLLYWGPGGCNARCRVNLYNTRQVRTALNRNMDRVQRVFVAGEGCCDWPYLTHEQPDLVTVLATRDAAPLLAILPAFDGIEPAAADRIYIIDPLGNVMMSYAPDAKPKGLLEDLKRLLGLSQVG